MCGMHRSIGESQGTSGNEQLTGLIIRFSIVIPDSIIQMCTPYGCHSSDYSEYDEAGEKGQVFDKEIWVIDVK